MGDDDSRTRFEQFLHDDNVAIVRRRDYPAVALGFKELRILRVRSEHQTVKQVHK